MGVPVTEEEKQATDAQATTMENINVNDSGFIEVTRKKKMFSSSSFYEEPNAIYPTVEEQVEMCRKIADSLSDDCNKKSRGASMFFRRVKKAEKWIVESQYENETNSESALDPSKMPYVKICKDPPKLKLLLDPRQIVDLKRLREEGVQIVEHNVSPEICKDIIKDLNSPTGKGAQLFAKRKKKSEEWVVDEEKVKNLQERIKRESGSYSPEPFDSQLPIKPLTHPRVQMIKTPWAAAMASPIGSCDGAFKELHNDDLAETVIKAAEAKVMSYPPPRYSAIEPLNFIDNATDFSFDSRGGLTQAVEHKPVPSQIYREDIYMSRAPRGWSSQVSGNSSFSSTKREEKPEENFSLSSFSRTPSSLSENFPISRTLSFQNFNTTPRAWSPGRSQTLQIKRIKPPSVLVQ